MLPAQPPNSRRICGTRNDTFSMWILSGRMCFLKRSVEHHDGVVGDRAADQRFAHVTMSNSRLRFRSHGTRIRYFHDLRPVRMSQPPRGARIVDAPTAGGSRAELSPVHAGPWMRRSNPRDRSRVTPASSPGVEARLVNAEHRKLFAIADDVRRARARLRSRSCWSRTRADRARPRRDVDAARLPRQRHRQRRRRGDRDGARAAPAARGHGRRACAARSTASRRRARSRRMRPCR